MTSLEGKVALVTGASRGIGAAAARALAAEGVFLALASRSGDDLGLPDAVARPCDVRTPADLEALVSEAVERFGRLDIVVANAGVGAYGAFLDLPPEQLEEMIDVNVKGNALRGPRGASPPHRERRGRLRHARVRGGPAWTSLRGGLLLLEVRPGRLHARARS